MGKADLHMHSTYSDGYQTVAQILQRVEQYTELDVIAITDHDCIDGALLARDLSTRNRGRIEVIVGAEISTRDGHLLALNIEHLIPANLPMSETIQAIHEQGGLAVVAHPLSRWCPSAKLATLLELAAHKDHTPDGIEIYNGSFAGVGSNNRVRELNDAQLGWSATGGSDAHTMSAIGSSSTDFPGSRRVDLLNALRQHRTVACSGFWSTLTFVKYTLTIAAKR
ncbi:MAG: PHP domain-containing protein [Chloroflexota bacterium]